MVFPFYTEEEKNITQQTQMNNRFILPVFNEAAVVST